MTGATTPSVNARTRVISARSLSSRTSAIL